MGFSILLIYQLITWIGKRQGDMETEYRKQNTVVVSAVTAEKMRCGQHILQKNGPECSGRALPLVERSF